VKKPYDSDDWGNMFAKSPLANYEVRRIELLMEAAFSTRRCHGNVSRSLSFLPKIGNEELKKRKPASVGVRVEA